MREGEEPKPVMVSLDIVLDPCRNIDYHGVVPPNHEPENEMFAAAQTISLPSRNEQGAIFAIDGAAPRTYRTRAEFEIDVFMKAERWSNGMLFAQVPGFFGFVEIDPNTVEFVARR